MVAAGMGAERGVNVLLRLTVPGRVYKWSYGRAGSRFAAPKEIFSLAPAGDGFFINHTHDILGDPPRAIAEKSLKLCLR